MKIRLTVDLIADHVEGKFSSKDEVAEEVVSMIESALDNEEVTPDDNVYTITVDSIEHTLK